MMLLIANMMSEEIFSVLFTNYESGVDRRRDLSTPRSYLGLVCGDVCGRFDQLFSRIKSVQKKAGNFEMLFCVGDFFGDDNEEWEKYKQGEATVPITTFVLGPNIASHLPHFGDPNGGDMCENVTYLGKKGIYTSTSGLTIAYLSGTDGTMSAASDGSTFTNDDIDSLRHSLSGDSKGVDILLTSPWAQNVYKYASKPSGLPEGDVGSPALAQLAISLRPRYHFCALEGVHYERQPYRNHQLMQETARHVTRYIALANVGNTGKHKFLYAFNISPLRFMAAAELTNIPDDATERPYRLDNTVIRSKKPTKDEKESQFFYDQKSMSRGGGRGGRGGRGGHDNKRHHDDQSGGQPSFKKHHPKATGPCWFCLGSAEVERHLVVSVGEQCYVALAKGGLTPDHVLICPIGHHQSTVSSPDDVVDEIEKYKSSIQKYMKSHGKATVYFERNYKSQHLQIQVVPVPLEMSGEVKETFDGLALSQNMELAEIPKHSDLKQIVPAGAPYFYAEMPTGERLLYRIKKGFPLQFGREALVDPSLLNMPLRADWRNCKFTKEEETSMATEYKNNFQKFDFTLV